MAMENGPFTGDVPTTSYIHRGLSIAMFDYQRVVLMKALSEYAYIKVYIYICIYIILHT